MDSLLAMFDLVSSFFDTAFATYLGKALMVSGLLAQLAAITPWKWDDGVMGGVQKLLNVIAGNWGHAK